MTRPPLNLPLDPPLSVDQITQHRRLRRPRQADWSRRLVRETKLSIDDLIWPIFLIDGHNRTEAVPSMPGVDRMTLDLAIKAAERAANLGIPLMALFPNTDPSLRDESGREALNEQNLVCRACRALKAAVPEIGLLTDVALDPYTSHGHDGLMRGEEILNDETIDVLCQQAALQAAAGCDILGPSDMMDGRVGAIRRHLDAKGAQATQIMSYTAKYASAFYGPFRQAVGSGARLKGDKRSYQMDYHNGDEALREAEFDIAEGADMLMVKPGMAYLDIVSRLKTSFQMPTYAYQVSGEYAMLMAAIEHGWLEADAVILEALTAFKRAGADGILTYFAPRVAELLRPKY